MLDDAKLSLTVIPVITALLIYRMITAIPLMRINVLCTVLTHKPTKQHLGDILDIACAHDLRTQRLSALHSKYW